MKSCKYMSAEELPMILNVQEVSDFIGLGMSQTYVSAIARISLGSGVTFSLSMRSSRSGVIIPSCSLAYSLDHPSSSLARWYLVLFSFVDFLPTSNLSSA